jgi:hypothetical protein
LKNLLSLAFIFVCTISSAQTDSSSIYYQALKYYSLHLDTIKSSDSIIFIEDRNSVFETEFKSIGSRNVIFLTTLNVKQIYKRNGNEIKHLTINSAQVSGDIIEVRFVPYFKVNPNRKIWGNRKKGKFLSLDDWITVQFKVDYQKKEFKFFKIKKPIASFPG